MGYVGVPMRSVALGSWMVGGDAGLGKGRKAGDSSSESESASPSSG